MTEHEPFVLFRDDAAGQVTLFADPADIIVARTREEFFAGLSRMETARAAGKWLAGYMAYEAGHLFEEKLADFAIDDRETPLLCFGVFDAPAQADHPLAQPRRRTENAAFLTDPRAEWNFAAYQQRFDRLHGHLRQGDCYQANLTMPLHARWNGDPLEAFWSLIERQPVKYGALIDLGGPAILSRSPELFFRVDEDGWIEAHPMKGTARRGASLQEDREIIRDMLADEKTQAENRMIVDLLRNDISRISEVGTLDVPRLFDIETYPTVHQMVSHVRAKLIEGTTVTEIFAALFPCGSVTGAPKIRAMEILHDLEAGPRDVYCGTTGFIAPNGPMRFSVAIRTITLFSNGQAVFNVGGGIVFDSRADAEYEECLLKARFAVGGSMDFTLIETIRFEPGHGMLRVDQHMKRLARSADALRFRQPPGVRKKLDDHIRDAGQALRLRMTLTQKGEVDITSTPFTPQPDETVWRLRVARTRIDSADPLIRHKTSKRDVYEAARAEYSAEEADEVILLNEKGDVCEGTITSIFVVDGSGPMMTPTLTSGLLSGVFRTDMICQQKARIQRLRLQDLNGRQIFVGNSVRGLIRAELMAD